MLASNGLPVAGIGVDLASLEYGTNVSELVDEGRVDAPDGLTTDRKGLVRVSGLPHGAYAWSVTTADGRVHGGRLVVLPGETARVPVRLP